MCIIDNITKIASSKGISQAFICEKLGKRRNYLFNLKTQNKNPSDDQMGIIANVLNVTVEELTGRTDDPTPEKEKSPSNDGLANDEALIVQLYRGAKSLDDKKSS